MKVRDIMTREMITIDASASAREAAEKMRVDHIGILPVMEFGDVVGIITDRDIAIRVVGEGRDPNDTLVRDVMTEEHFSCFDDQDDTQAVRMMEQRQIRRLLVINRDRDLVGILSIDDLAAQPGNEALACEVLRQVTAHTPHKP